MNAQDGSVVAPTEKIAQQGQNVNQKHSRELETVEELKQQNELLKKQGNRRKAWLVRLAGSCGTCRRQPRAQHWKEGKKKNAPEGVKYSIQNIIRESGQDYGVGVYLDSQLLSGLTDSERITMVKEFVKELGGQSFTAYEPDGSETAIKIAEPNQRFQNKSGKSVPFIGDLTTKYNKNITKQEAIVLIDELVATSQYQRSEPAKHTHGWLDNNEKTAGNSGLHTFRTETTSYGRRR